MAEHLLATPTITEGGGWTPPARRGPRGVHTPRPAGRDRAL